MTNLETKKITYLQTTTVLDKETGELKTSELITDALVSREPDYVKLYLNTVLVSKNLPTTHNPLLNEILLRMTYANIGDGQVVYIVKDDKEFLAKKLKSKPDTIRKAISDFVKVGILKKITTGKYQVNPHMFGKGDWKDIRRIRATFVFESPEKSEKNKENEGNENE